jgi:16S rRNA (adenine1518-N6/adenine1519-N6)-dimethyltransferase
MPKKNYQDSVLTQTKGQLRQAGLRARKSLAQHFLIDEAVLHKVVTAAALRPTDVVIEVGPGLGVLTKELVQNAGKVIAVELDDELAVKLKDTLSLYTNLSIIHGDALAFQPRELLKGQESKTYKVIANIPYYITSALLRHFLEADLKPEIMVVMVQKEIAQAVTAAPGDMSLLAVSVQLYGKPEVVCYVPSSSFYPPPKVDSAILKIQVYPKPVLDIDEESFFKLVRAGFTASRKQITNSLVQGLGVEKSEVLAKLAKAGIETTRRSESLSLEEWGKLWWVFQE